MKNNIQPDIEQKALEVLQSTGSLRLPVPIEKVARSLGLHVEAAALGEGVAGVLVVEGDRGTIGYNEDQPHVRQRFSVAHEVGHFILHRSTGNLFIDKHYVAVYRRDRDSSTGEDLYEVQANRFAAAILMPKALIDQEVITLEFDLGDEQALQVLAGRFEVSLQAMSIRLANLGFFDGHKS